MGSSDLKREYKSILQHLHLANRSGGSAAVDRSFPDSSCGAGDTSCKVDEDVCVIPTEELCWLWQAAGGE